MERTHIDHRAVIDHEAGAGVMRSAIALVEAIIADAHARRASDIHIRKRATEIRIELRIDGLLQESYSLPVDCHAELVSRIKILAGLRTDEHFVAHDGRFSMRLESGIEIAVRISIVPTHHGENAVLRLLTHAVRPHTLQELGMPVSDEKVVLRALFAPDGLLLFVGPTGSGKTSTLYALLQILQQGARSLISIEDPVEYELTGVTQIPVHERYGMTFATGLRALLRQDPDVIVVGEIRDAETAELAVQAARTGHLVLSTLHTRDTASMYSRLSHLGIDASEVSSVSRLVLAQRLVRKICSACTKAHLLTPSETEYLSRRFPGVEFRNVFKGVGCSACDGRGYSGRIGIFEVATNILKNTSDLQSKTLLDDASEKISFGLTTVEEVIRVFHGS